MATATVEGERVETEYYIEYKRAGLPAVVAVVIHEMINRNAALAHATNCCLDVLRVIVVLLTVLRD